MPTLFIVHSSKIFPWHQNLRAEAPSHPFRTRLRTTRTYTYSAITGLARLRVRSGGRILNGLKGLRFCSMTLQLKISLSPPRRLDPSKPSSLAPVSCLSPSTKQRANNPLWALFFTEAGILLDSLCLAMEIPVPGEVFLWSNLGSRRHDTSTHSWHSSASVLLGLLPRTKWHGQHRFTLDP